MATGCNPSLRVNNMCHITRRAFSLISLIERVYCKGIALKCAISLQLVWNSSQELCHITFLESIVQPSVHFSPHHVMFEMEEKKPKKWIHRCLHCNALMTCPQPRPSKMVHYKSLAVKLLKRGGGECKGKPNIIPLITRLVYDTIWKIQTPCCKHSTHGSKPQLDRTNIPSGTCLTLVHPLHTSLNCW